jgi:hypothetical protein
MDRDLSSFEQAILKSVCEDILPFERVIEDLCAQHERDPEFDKKHIQSAMLHLISRGLMGVYLLHTEPPYITPVDADLTNLHRYWITLTDKGQKALRAALRSSP